MLKVFLRHKLYEYCINLIFDSFTKNFIIPKSAGICIGDTFKYVEIKDHLDRSVAKLYDVILVSCREVVFFGEKYKAFRFVSAKDSKLMYDTVMGEICDFIK